MTKAAEKEVPANTENGTEEKAEAVGDTGWDALFEGAIEEKRSENRKSAVKVEVPASLVERVEKLYTEKKRERLPVKDDEHFEKLRNALFSACEESALNISVRCMSMVDEKTKQRFIQYTVSGKRGRPKGSKNS